MIPAAEFPWKDAGASAWVWWTGCPDRFRAQPLRARLQIHQGAVRAGVVDNLRESVKYMSARYSGWLEEELREQPRRLSERQRRRRIRGWTLARAKVPPGPCAYCGAPDAKHIDHVIPRCQGGTDDLANLARACARCNARKGPRTPEQWRRGDNVRAFWPQPA